MTPFLQLRLWWRRAPVPNRIMSSVAMVAFVALVAWLVLPTDDVGTGDVETVAPAGAPGAGGAAPGATVPGGAPVTVDPAAGGGGPGSPAAGAGSGGDAGGGGTPAAGAPGGGTSVSGGACLATPPDTPGVDDATITIGFGYPNLAGAIGNSAVGLASPEEFRAMARAVVDDVNAAGGVQCRQLAIRIYEGNPINQDQTQSTCLQVGQDAPFMFADAGAFVYPLGQYGCLAQQRIPTVTVAQPLTSDIDRFFPYLASTSADTETEMHTAVLGAQQRGFFDPANGFVKLGILMDDCTPEVNEQFEAALDRAGIPDEQVSRYVFSCPGGGFASPAEMAQAVVQFKNRDGVTHVVPLTGGGSFLSFSQAAEQQRYRPRYLVTNYNGFIITATTPTGPNAENFHGALAISLGTYGMDTTPGHPVDAGTARCQEVLGRAGFGPEMVFAPQGGGVCSAIWTAVAAINATPQLTREAVLQGLFAAGPVQLAYSYPDTVFSAPRKLFGGDSWSALQFDKACYCWRIISDGRLPSFRAG